MNALISKFDLSGFIQIGGDKSVDYEGRKYSICKYQGKHEDEFVVKEMKDGKPNGQVQLFRDNVLQQSWTEKDGKEEGNLTIYKDGIAQYILRWCDLKQVTTRNAYDNTDDKYDNVYMHMVVNNKNGCRRLEIRSVRNDVVVYRGEYNDSLECEGLGIAYDEESGVEKWCGYYKNGKLACMYQRFEKEEDDDNGDMRMIEYVVLEKEENQDNRIPIYIGGYVFDEKTNRFYRNGMGKVIDADSGICDRISQWDHGKEIEGSECVLYGGWYDEGTFDKSLRLYAMSSEEISLKMEEEKEKERLKDQVMICPGLEISVTRGLEEYISGDYVIFGSGWDTTNTKLVFSELPCLKRIVIGNYCFPNVRELLIDNDRTLTEVTIGDRCFMQEEKGGTDGICQISNCEALSEIEIGKYSFYDYNRFELISIH